MNAMNQSFVGRRGGPTLLLIPVLIVIASAAAAGPLELRVDLKFVPTDAEEVLEKRGVVSVAGPPFEIVSAVDQRPEPRNLIGENREKRRDPYSRQLGYGDGAIPVRAASDVASWITRTLTDTFRDWGTPSVPGAVLVLRTEIVKLFVVEEHTYQAEANMKFTLERRNGPEIWSGVVGGAATRFGRSLKAENYREVISDAVFACYSKLWVDPAFRAAWAGKTGGAPAVSDARPEKPVPSETLSPGAAMAKVLELKAAGFEEEAVIAWVRSVALTRPLSADDMLEWKSAGVPQSVIRAAMGSE